MSVQYLRNGKVERLAYVHTPAVDGVALPAVMFLGGFKSDMCGSKALFLEEKCRARGQEFVRFDYTGHGESDGSFEDGCIGSWKNDARDIFDHVLNGDVILVGSSMGGWISFLLMKERASRIKAVIGIAAAPDFTKDIMAQCTELQILEMQNTGRIAVPNDYSDDPYIFTQNLINDGDQNALLHMAHDTEVPMTLLQGKCDDSVHWEKVLRIKECFSKSNVDIIFIDDGDHRLSRDQDLSLLDTQVQKYSSI